jgi:hypothetical protein
VCALLLSSSSLGASRYVDARRGGDGVATRDKDAITGNKSERVVLDHAQTKKGNSRQGTSRESIGEAGKLRFGYNPTTKPVNGSNPVMRI